MELGYCDLHVHTHRSDALSVWSPKKVLLRARQLGIKHIALSDHNMLNEDWLSQSLEFGIDVISSTEMSASYTDGGLLFEPHLVGFRVNPQEKEIQRIAKIHQQNRAGYLNAMLDGLRICPEAIDISYEELLEANPNSGHIGRVAIGDIIITRGLAENMDEVYARWLGRESGAPSYVDSKRFLIYENLEAVIRGIMKACGLPIVAHLPYLNMTEEQEYRFLSIVKEIAGDTACMETEYGDYPRQTVERLKRLAKHFGMAESTGSDFHGYKGSNLKCGNPEIYQKLQEKWEKHYG